MMKSFVTPNILWNRNIRTSWLWKVPVQLEQLQHDIEMLLHISSDECMYLYLKLINEIRISDKKTMASNHRQ